MWLRFNCSSNQTISTGYWIDFQAKADLGFYNLNPKVLRLFCQWLVTWRDSWTMEWKVRQDFWHKTMGRYTKQPIKKRYFI